MLLAFLNREGEKVRVGAVNKERTEELELVSSIREILFYGFRR